jgi:hypothetical protein
VTLTTTTATASIRYTLNGDEPTATTGQLYTGPFTLSATATLKARAFQTGWIDSNTVTGLFTINIPQPVGDPTISPNGGTFTTPQSVTLTTTTATASIRYTLNGDEPTATTGQLYTGPFTLSATATLKVRAFQTGWIDSSVVAKSFTISPSATGGIAVTVQ